MRITSQLQAMLHAEQMEAERRDFQKWWTLLRKSFGRSWSHEHTSEIEIIAWAAWRKGARADGQGAGF